MLYGLLSLSLLPLNVIAAVEDAEMAEQADAVETKPKTSMLRQTSPVVGYQALSVAGQAIDATYLEETFGERHGAIVFFHDQGEQFESPGVITPLRHQLAEYGWSTLTLSLDLPFEPKVMLSTSLNSEMTAGEQEIEEKAPEQTANVLPPVSNSERIEAAWAFLKAKDIDRVVFVGHGKGGDVALEILASKTFSVAGLILVGVTALDSNETFSALEMPILEVYGSQDLDGVKKAIKHRKALMKRDLETDHTIRKVIGANHVYYGLEPMLLMTVRSWLNAKYIKQPFP
jgi:dienelactone hydrolase